MDYIFVKFFGLGLGLSLDCFWSRSQTLGLEILQSRFRSRSRRLWSRLHHWFKVNEINYLPDVMGTQGRRKREKICPFWKRGYSCADIEAIWV